MVYPASSICGKPIIDTSDSRFERQSGPRAESQSEFRGRREFLLPVLCPCFALALPVLCPFLFGHFACVIDPFNGALDMCLAFKHGLFPAWHAIYEMEINGHLHTNPKSSATLIVGYRRGFQTSFGAFFQEDEGKPVQSLRHLAGEKFAIRGVSCYSM
ncbi:hypothetical protein B0I72DRAFT_41868 [Yarrowia lipolytica]|uniref:Uncharacterized protein n=1 Tax=Yarrowia lipolytica TaxID=4952 RepID=A0A371C7Q4_YARLL|nr:hypothetical protein BKA91DRAFT_28893 [Yarrowia lipolytica]KAE8170392.1 hypothetical protein BKA90DRAFT_36754 [Yarrowia lipolytica]RDW26334.1 hypothetical protein B0I71DRAFT_32784 [Yarrowia lipolytica]RDW31928.1 hypothetical protein B0I72DRAFT_41868 [Yarrowia lipolytica]RDW38495.1 hypothetical protein B0I73DRAFT_44071 [Yarrowia lipolytica]